MAAAATRSHAPLPAAGGVRIGYANTGGHPETLGSILDALKGNNVDVVAEFKDALLDGSLHDYELVHKDGVPPVAILENKKSHRGIVSDFVQGKHDNTRPFFCGSVKVTATKRILLCGVHLKSGKVAKANEELETIQRTLTTVAESRGISDIIIVGDFNRADHPGSLTHFTGGVIFEGGGHAKWNLDRVYYFHKDGAGHPLSVHVEPSEGNSYDHGHVGFRITVETE